MPNTTDIPRWAKELKPRKWEALNDLLLEGWDVSDIMRKLSIPENKRRSLQTHSQKFGPRRRLNQFALFKDAMVNAAVSMGPEFAAAMTLVAKNAISPDVKASTQAEACRLMLQFSQNLAKVMEPDALAEQERTQAEAQRDTTPHDPQEALRRICEIYQIEQEGETP